MIIKIQYKQPTTRNLRFDEIPGGQWFIWVRGDRDECVYRKTLYGADAYTKDGIISWRGVGDSGSYFDIVDVDITLKVTPCR